MVGRIKKLPSPRMEKKLWLIGCLVGYTRQLDVRMNSEQDLDQYLDDFLQRTVEKCGVTSPAEEVL